jgi:hypothetical protein
VHLRGEAGKGDYRGVPVEESDKGERAAPARTPWGAYSSGGESVTLWKGFQRRHAQGMTLQHRKAAK